MNTEIKEDRRVRKTKRALREGLAELLTEKSIQKITVRELADKVDIHRSTFYANFTDIYDLYSRLTGLLKEAYLDCWRNEYGATGTTEELEYYVHFYLSGSLAVVDKWVEDGFQYPAEQLVKIFADMEASFGKLVY